MGIHAQFAGYFRLQVKEESGELKTDTGWFPNLITNQGLDWFGAGAPVFNTTYSIVRLCTHCGVGTGNTAPAFTDTQLTAFLAMFPSTTGSNIEGFSSSQYVAGPPAYWSGIFTYNFAQGAVVGNIAEVGCGNTAQTDTQPKLFNHALILDGGGNPTTISVLSTDSLTVTYELRMYLNLTDSSYNVSINGTTYSGTQRMGNVTSVPQFATQCDSWSNPPLYYSVTNGTIGTTSQGISGSGFTCSSYSEVGTYTPGSYTKQWSFTEPANSGFAVNISAVAFQTNMGYWQFSVSPVLIRPLTQSLNMVMSISWSRYP